MNKFFKVTVVAAVTFTAAGVFAAPPHHDHDDRNNGIRLATDIINLVSSSIKLLTGTPDTVIVNQQAIVTTPVVTTPVVTTQIITTPTIVAPPPRPVIIHNPRPVHKPKHVNYKHNKPDHRPNKPHKK